MMSSQECVRLIMDFGFSEEQALTALLIYPGNHERALDYLL